MGVESTVKDPVSVHLKNIDSWYIRVLEQVAQLEVGTEGGLLDAQGDGAAVGDVVALYGRLQKAEIME